MSYLSILLWLCTCVLVITIITVIVFYNNVNDEDD